MANVTLNIITTYKDQGEKAFKGALQGLSTFANSSAGQAITGIGAGIATGLAGATIAVTNFSDDVTGAMQSFSSQTGVANDELEQYKDIALDLFASNWGESVDDVAQAMAEVQNTTGAANDELRDLTENALILRDRFGKDVPESIDAAKVLMDEFGLSSEQAFDFIAAGQQRGLDRSGDFLDTIREYSAVMDDNGLSAAEFFSIMETGNAAGVLGTDKIIDGYKEAGIRLRELNDAGKDALQTIGVDTEAIFSGLSDGSVTVADALEQILPAILAIDDPVQRQIIGVQTFGTMWEDLGESAFASLDTTKTQLSDLTGAMDDASQSGATIGEAWEQGMRRLRVATEPIGAEIAPMLVEALGGVSDFLVETQPIFSEFAQTFGETLKGSMLIIADSLERIGPAIGLTGENAEASEVALAALEETLDGINTVVQGLAVGFSIFADLVEWVSEVNEQLDGWLSKLGQIAAFDITGLGTLGNALSGGGFGGSSSEGFFGFNTGGTFTVGGAGGPDSQLVMFRASPGENVTVSQPGQSSVPGINTGRVSGAVMQAASKMAAQMLKQFENDLVKELTR